METTTKQSPATKSGGSIMISIAKGDKIIYEGKKGTIVDYRLVPNGRSDRKIVCLIYAKLDNGRMVSSASENFSTDENSIYEKFYPTPHLFKLKNL